MAYKSIASQYAVSVENHEFHTVAVFDHFVSATITKEVNGIGGFSLTFYDNNDERFEEFIVDAIVKFWRAVPDIGLNTYLEFTGLVRRTERRIDLNGDRVFTVSGYGLNHLLSRRVVAYKEGTIRASKNTYAERAIKQYVSENCGVDAGHPTRISNGIMESFYVQAEHPWVTLTPIWSGEKSFVNLLDVVKEISDYTKQQVSSGGVAIEFDVIPVDGGGFEFRTYRDQLGTDRTVEPYSVTFSADIGNVESITVEYDRTREVNVAIVLGRGERSTRFVISRRNTLEASASPWNDIEVARAASLNEFTYQLNAFGDSLLEEGKYRPKIEVVPQQVPYSAYGLHYFLGDIVRVAFEDYVEERQISSVSINLSEGSTPENITFTLSPIPGS